MSLSETACLIAEFKALETPKVDLSRYSEAHLKAVQDKQRVSDSVLGFTFTKPFHDFKFYQFDFVVQCYFQNKRFGVLPYPGSLSEQPNKIIECFNILRSVEFEQDEKTQKKQAQLQKRQSKK